MTHLFVLVGASVAALGLSAHTADSTRVNVLGEAQVVSNRATSTTPIAYANLGKAAIERVNKGQDIPFLLSTLPSVVVTSDAGNGIGYTGIRVRGTDATRINVTGNGIPMNDPESHSLFWVNMGDFASSLNDLQLQRGVGTSTMGAGAFGASINMVTERAGILPAVSLNTSGGSYNTAKGTLKLSSGLLNNHWAFDARLSRIVSDGYRDRATARLASYFTQAAYLNVRTTFKLIAFGGQEETYHAWDGISREQLVSHRTYNPNGEIRAGKKVIGFYDRQIDHYFQQHVQALFDHRPSDHWNLSAALQYTRGKGYYEEYKNARKLKDYALVPFTLNGIRQERSDLVRRKYLDNHFFGGIASLRYHRDAWDVSFGGGANYYTNDHYGRVIWVKDYVGNLRPDHEYYRNNGEKFDGNTYLRANYAVTSSLHLYADLQHRFIDYKIEGTSDKKAKHDTHEQFSFFNPKIGIVRTLAKQHRLYASVSIARREPTRNNYEESFSDHAPRAERLIDYEAGYSYESRRFTAGVNLYWMHYKDQFVPNGRYNDIGEAVLENVPSSHRAGVELTAAWQPHPRWTWEGNLTLSNNRIDNYVAYLYDEDGKEYERRVGKTTIAFSPSLTFNHRLAYHHQRWEASLTSQYVGRQYLDNLEMQENALDPYFVTHLNASYTFPLRGTKGMSLGATIYNLFNERYETNGYSMTSIDKASGKLVSDPRFYPMAGINFMVDLGVKF